jgi:hypothetical protein
MPLRRINIVCVLEGNNAGLTCLLERQLVQRVKDVLAIEHCSSGSKYAL